MNSFLETSNSNFEESAIEQKFILKNCKLSIFEGGIQVLPMLFQYFKDHTFFSQNRWRADISCAVKGDTKFFH